MVHIVYVLEGRWLRLSMIYVQAKPRPTIILLQKPWEIFKTGFLRATSGPAGFQPMFAKWFVFPQLNN